MNEGWIKSYRRLLDWEWFTDPKTAHFFHYCILKANPRDKEWRGVVIKRGAFVSSLQKMSEESGLSVREVRTSLQRLISTKELTSESTNRYTIVTICNYEKYQSNEEAERQTNRQAYRQASDNQMTNERQTNDNNEEYKEDKEEENKLNNTPQCVRTREEEIAEITLYWNHTINIPTKQIVKIDESNPQRLFRINKALEYYGLDRLKLAVDKVSKSSYLLDHPYFNFDGACTDFEKIERLLSGQLDDKRKPTRTNDTPDGVKLGYDEYIDRNGRRTYGKGVIEVPMDAPPRPSASEQWSNAMHKWFYAI